MDIDTEEANGQKQRQDVGDNNITDLKENLRSKKVFHKNKKDRKILLLKTWKGTYFASEKSALSESLRESAYCVVFLQRRCQQQQGKQTVLIRSLSVNSGRAHSGNSSIGHRPSLQV